MFDYPSKADIETISMDLLKQSKSIDVFPTPVNNILNYSDLKVDTNIDLSKIDKSLLLGLSTDAVQKIIDSINQVRGVLDRKEKIIYLDLSQGINRQNFVKLHEIGHEVLNWQNEILECIDDDGTLNPNVLEEFEAEANYFASTILFQNDRFEIEMAKHQLGIKAPMSLSKKFGASNHATLRKYVECSKNRCALIVLEKITLRGEQPICFTRDFFQSMLFVETFGLINFPDKLGYRWDFVRDYYFGKRYHENGKITLDTENGIVDFKYHFFNNTFNAFVFLFPVGEVNDISSNVYL